MSTGAVRTEEANVSTKYTYNYTYLPPLAIAGAVAEAEKFSARPERVSLVAVPALKILVNSVMTDPVIRKHLTTFQQELIGIVEEITERNRTRTPYEFLLPSKIPQSINI